MPFSVKFLIRLGLFSSLLTPAIIISSCTSLSHNQDTLDSKQESLLLAFNKAKALEKSDVQGSCSLYARLSGEAFPLKQLSLLKAHMICTETANLPTPLPQVPENLGSQFPWLAGMDIDRMILTAERKQNFSGLARAHFKKAQWSDKIRDKIVSLQTAQSFLEKVPATNQSNEDQALSEELQNRLVKLAPRFISNPKNEDYFKVASDLIFQRKFELGRSFLGKIMDSEEFNFDDQYNARRAYRNSFKTEQKKEQYQIESQKFAKWIDSKGFPQKTLEAYMIWARAAWTEGDLKEAKLALSIAEKKLKGKTSIEEIFYVRGKMFEEAKNFDQALKHFEIAEKESKPKSNLRDKILFSKAWMLRRQGKFAEAVLAFTSLKNETQDPFDKNKYTFWLARSKKQAALTAPKTNQSDQPTDTGEVDLKELTQMDPLGFYGLIAYRELNTELPALEIESAKSKLWLRPSAVESYDHQLIRALNYVGEFSVLEKFLDLRTQDLKNQNTQDPEKWLYYFKAYAMAGLYNPLFQQLGSLSIEFKNQLLTQNPELIFPRKFLDLIQTNAERFNVKPELILSIIRQESAFNPLARSGADALGLMQVIPSVAHDHETKTGIRISTFEDLYKPEVNIPIGASLLSALGKRYRGQFVLTAAAYNANEKAIESWLKTRLDEDPLEFIENIPYEETRGYVKLVLRNFIFYSRLNQAGSSTPFPNWCLEDLQSFKVSTR